MNLWRVSLRNVRIRAVSSVLTCVSIALGVMLLAGLWMLSAQAERHYKASFRGFDAIVGPKEGSPLSLVLSTVYNLGYEPGVVSLDVYEDLRSGRLARRWGTRYAIPQARGDSFADFPIIGTTDEMFSKFHLEYTKEGERRIPHPLKFAEGGAWSFSHEDLLAFAARRLKQGAGEDVPLFDGAKTATVTAEDGHEIANIPTQYRQAVIGAKVARELGAGVGFAFTPVHGKRDEVGAHVHDEARCRVVGVLEPTGSPVDAGIYIPLGTFLALDGHADEQYRPGHELGATFISAVIVSTKHPTGPENLRKEFGTRSDAQVAIPRTEIPQLLKLVGDVKQLLDVISWMVLIVAAIAILVALYNTMNERRREIAIMRSLGARRWQIGRIIVQEALTISLIGAVVGVIGCHVAAYLLADVVSERTSVPLDWATFHWRELVLVGGVGALGVVAGLVPAAKGSLTEVAENLAPTS